MENEDIKRSASVTITVSDVLQPFASIATTEYVPDPILSRSSKLYASFQA